MTQPTTTPAEIEALCKRLEREASNHLTGIPGPRRVVGSQMLEAAAKLREMAGALEKARDQFASYAREHRAAGKDEKATTNQRFADMLAVALAGGSHG